MDYTPAPDEWSIGEVVDHLILSEKLIREDIAELIALSKAGREPRLYRSFADFNARPFFMPKCALPFLEIPLSVLTLFVPGSIRDFVVRYTPVRALAADVALPLRGKPTAELLDGLRSSLQETEVLFVANPTLDYDRMRHQHPLSGVQTVPELLNTLGLHEQSHHEQIAMILASSRFPRAA